VRSTEDLSVVHGTGKLESMSTSDEFILFRSVSQVRSSIFNYMRYCLHGLTISHRYCSIDSASVFLRKHISAMGGSWLTPQTVTPVPNCATPQYHGMATWSSNSMTTCCCGIDLGNDNLHGALAPSLTNRYYRLFPDPTQRLDINGRVETASFSSDGSLLYCWASGVNNNWYIWDIRSEYTSLITSGRHKAVCGRFGYYRGQVLMNI